MKKLLQVYLMWFISIAAVNLLVSCKPKSADRPVSVNQRTELVETSNNTDTVQGTSDSGGGTGIDGKVFESYIVNPTKLEAYSKIVLPLLNQIKNEKGEMPIQFEGFFNMRTWYVAPVDLSRIDKDRLGVAFFKSDTQQLARQSLKEIWIDKRVFDRMSLKDQGELMLHELIMTMYMLRFEETEDICNSKELFLESILNESCRILPSSLVKILDAETQRALTEDDNQKIRNIVGWILQNTNLKNAALSFVRMIYFKNFDRRFFNPFNYESIEERPKNLQVSKEIFVNAFKLAEMSGHSPEFCVDQLLNKIVPCRMSFKINTNIDKPGSSAFELNVNISESSIVNIKSFIPEQLKLIAYKDYAGKVFYTATISSALSDYAVGSLFKSAILIFRLPNFSQKRQILLESVIIKSGIIISIDKDRIPICNAISISSPISFEQGLVAFSKENDDLLKEQMFLGLPPAIECSAKGLEI